MVRIVHVNRLCFSGLKRRDRCFFGQLAFVKSEDPLHLFSEFFGLVKKLRLSFHGGYFFHVHAFDKHSSSIFMVLPFQLVVFASVCQTSLEPRMHDQRVKALLGAWLTRPQPHCRIDLEQFVYKIDCEISVVSDYA